MNYAFSKDQDSQDNKKEEDLRVPYWRLFSFATWTDWGCMVLGSLCAIITGSCMTIFLWFYSQTAGLFINYETSIRNASINTTEKTMITQRLKDDVFVLTMNCVGLGFLTITCQYIAGFTFSYSSLRQIYKIRHKFLEKILHQDIAWYDANRTGDFATTFSENLMKIEDGIGTKVTYFLYFTTVFVVSVIWSLFLGWSLTLICLVPLPLSVGLMASVSWYSTIYANREAELNSEAGAIAEEVFSSIRTVVAFDGHKKELTRYIKPMREAKNSNLKRNFFAGINNGFLWFCVYAGCGASFYFGITMLIEERDLPPDQTGYKPETIVMIFCEIFTAYWMFTNIAPYFQIFETACTAAGKVFKVLDSEPKINVQSKRGLQLEKLSGDICFKDVFFNYPSRPDVTILNGVSIEIRAGETVAFVGSSGSGKSTCIQLLQRFYDPIAGEIRVDNINVVDLNIQWLRNRTGVVGQEPALFATTIFENIRYGKPSATREDVERAAKKANVHKFIKSLPYGYDTVIGERGTQLSGGQKQRIAIARALVKEPSILLLDEATSALDTTSEAEVKAAIDSVCKDCTTIIVAHRLSTVRNANRIFVFAEGKIVEQGSYRDLINAKATFYELVKLQQLNPLALEQEIGENQTVNDNRNSQQDKGEFQFEMNEFQQNEDSPDEVNFQYGGVLQVLKKNKPEWCWIFIGCVASVIFACSLPTYSTLFGDVVGLLAVQDSQQLMNSTEFICFCFLLLAVASGILNVIQIYSFGVAGENLTLRIRAELFEAIMRQEIGWFEMKENEVGALCTRLAGDSADLQGAAGMPIGILLLSLCTIFISNGLAIYFQWKLALALIVFVPLIFIGVYFEQEILRGDSDVKDKKLRTSAAIAVEAISSIRTVVSLGCEDILLTRYQEELLSYIKSEKKGSHFRAIILGFSQSLVYLSVATALNYSTKLIIEEGVYYGTVLKVCELVVYSSWALSNTFAFLPNFHRGIRAAGRIFALLGRTPRIKNVPCASKKPLETGNVTYSNVYFSYPTRPKIPILRNLNLDILAGKTVALVGSSGCGKSTVIQLLQRFHNPTAGEVCIDDVDIEIMDMQHLRAQFAIVSQEPNLFDKTIAENIAYGNNEKIVPRHEIIEAAKDANIHEFITSLPLGYETRLGSKGSLLSGGQKQRIAIARALVRNPRVLLLDEATSALDNESEKVVQKALDKASRTRTCITIAHRLSTVQDADLICVLHKGKVVEMGRHQELIGKRGFYYDFYKSQSETMQ